MTRGFSRAVGEECDLENVKYLEMIWIFITDTVVRDGNFEMEFEGNGWGILVEVEKKSLFFSPGNRLVKMPPPELQLRQQRQSRYVHFCSIAQSIVIIDCGYWNKSYATGSPRKWPPPNRSVRAAMIDDNFATLIASFLPCSVQKWAFTRRRTSPGLSSSLVDAAAPRLRCCVWPLRGIWTQSDISDRHHRKPWRICDCYRTPPPRTIILAAGVLLQTCADFAQMRLIGH